MKKFKQLLNYVGTIRGSSWLMALAFLMLLSSKDTSAIIFGLSLVCEAIESLGCKCDCCDDEEEY